jgi:hypothetical protein
MTYNLMRNIQTTMAQKPDLFRPKIAENRRHWSPQSEEYASGEVLLHALEDDWHVQGVIFRQEVWLTGDRRTYVYHLELARGNETLKMKMVNNPFITRLIYKLNVQVVRRNERKSTEKERW